MLKSIEVQGRTEDEAIELALTQLGLSRDDVSVEVLETAKSGLFGLKNTPAVVKVEYEAEEGADEPVPAADSSVSKSKNKASAKKESKAAESKVAESKTTDSKAAEIKSTENKTAESKSTAADSEFTERLKNYLNGLFERMDLKVGLEITDKSGSVNVVLTTADPGVLIGRRGETLDALQHLTNYSINRSAAGRVRIHLDAENYRQRRSEALESLAVRTAGKVVKYRRNMTLDPMNAYERHVIHTALQDHGQVSTYSIGSEANRRVVVAYGQGKGAQDHTDSPQYKEWH